jgi:hypothetical protein
LNSSVFWVITLCNIPEDRRIQFNHSGSLRSSIARNFGGNSFNYSSGGVPFMCFTVVIHSVVLPYSVLQFLLFIVPVTVKNK